MDNNKISTFINALIKEKKYKKKLLVEDIGISSQGFNNWLKKSDNQWNLDSLMILSKLLGFNLLLDKGEIKLMKENKTIEIERTNEKYEVYRSFGKYSVVYLYTPNGNLNYDETPDLLEESFYLYHTEKECKKAHPYNTAIKLYTLLNNETNEIVLDRLTGIYPYKAESHYYHYLAPTIGYTEDNYEIIEKFEDKNLQIVKAGAFLEFDGNKDYTVSGFSSNPHSDGYLPGFALMPLNGSSNEFITWANNIEHLYYKHLDLSDMLVRTRYFDLNRDEIFEGDILVKKGITSEVSFLFDDDYKDDNELNSYFKKQETIRVDIGSYNSYLAFNIYGMYYNLNELNLLMWEKLEY